MSDTNEGITFSCKITPLKAIANGAAWRADGNAFVVSNNDRTLNVVSRGSDGYWNAIELNFRKRGCEQAKWLYYSDSQTTPYIVFVNDYFDGSCTYLTVVDVTNNKIVTEFPIDGRVIRGNGFIVERINFIAVLTNGIVKIGRIMVNQRAGAVEILFSIEPSIPITFVNNKVWHRNYVPVAAFHPSLSRIYVTKKPSEIVLLDLVQTTIIQQFTVALETDNDFIRTIAVTPYYNNLIITTASGLIQIISTKSQKVLWEQFIPLPINYGAVKHLAHYNLGEQQKSMQFHLIGYGIPSVSADDQQVSCGLFRDGNGCFVVWNTRRGTKQILGKFSDIPYITQFSQTHPHLATCALQTCIWDLIQSSTSR